MNQWTILKEYEFEDRTVRLYRSNCALRLWRGETVFKDGDSKSIELDDEALGSWLFVSK